MKVMEGLSYQIMDRVFSPVELHVGHYSNERLALYLVWINEQGWEEHLLHLTCNLENEDCPEGQVWVRSWSENEATPQWLKDNEVIEECAACNTQTGYAQCERYRLTNEFLLRVAQALEGPPRSQR